jgi:SAP domain-containing ribonucleoprotein
MVDYNKLNKPDLEAQLKERGLPHSGKKADLVARLQSDDKKKDETGAETTTDAPKPAAAVEDEIDWDDDTEAPAAKTDAAPSESAPAPITTTETTTVEPVTEADASKPTEEEKPKEKTPVDFSMGLAEITIDEEIEKRKARAKKYGMTETDPAAAEALQRLERSKKFGSEASGPKGLNEALPDRKPKRGREGGDDRSDFKRRGQRGPRGRGGGQRNSGRNDNRRPAQQPAAGGKSNWTDEDKKAAEKRKERFAASS